jgi:hypothetical protein
MTRLDALIARLLIHLSWVIELAAYDIDPQSAYAESKRQAEKDSRTHHDVARDYGVAA